MLAGVGGTADRAGAHRPHGRTRVRGRRPHGLSAPGWKRAYTVLNTCVRVGAGDVVDVSAIVFVPADEADRGDRRQRNVDESLDRPAGAAVVDSIGVEVVTCLELGGVRFVGDDADGARLGARTIQSALRSFENLDPLNVIQVNVDQPFDGV